MKETIYQKLERLLQDIKDRRVMLHNQEKEYRENGDYSKALDRRSKNEALLPIETRVEEILKP